MCKLISWIAHLSNGSNNISSHIQTWRAWLSVTTPGEHHSFGCVMNILLTSLIDSLIISLQTSYTTKPRRCVYLCDLITSSCWLLFSSHTTREISRSLFRSILKPSLTTHLRQPRSNSPSLRRDRWWVFVVTLEQSSNSLVARSLILGGVRPVFITSAVHCLCQGLSHMVACQNVMLIQ